MPTAALKAVLDFHNEVRSKHGSRPLSWDEGLASSAASYSKRCILQHSTQQERGDAGRRWFQRMGIRCQQKPAGSRFNGACRGVMCTGENLALGYNSFLDGAKAWAAEEAKYTGAYSPETGHYTQVRRFVLCQRVATACLDGRQHGCHGMLLILKRHADGLEGDNQVGLRLHCFLPHVCVPIQSSWQRGRSVCAKRWLMDHSGWRCLC